MSGHNYITNPNNLFEEVDDDAFLKNSRHNAIKSPTPSTNPFAEDINQQQIYEEKRKEIEQRTIQSSNRSLGLLRETEQVGIATAEELSRQREQLERTNNQLDNINTNLRYSQKHLNGIKSMFSGLKNYLSGQQQKDPSITSPKLMSSSPSGSKISSSIDEQHDHHRKNDTMSPDDLYDQHPLNRIRNDDSPQQQQKAITSASFSEQLDRNLDEMVGSLSRLKGLAMDLNQEIDTQNELIDNITDKVEVADVKINRQNKDMNKLLGKK